MELAYIDVCALSRPFDNQDYLRIRLETEAVSLILLKVREGSLRLLISPAHLREIEAIPDSFERIIEFCINNGTRIGIPQTPSPLSSPP